MANELSEKKITLKETSKNENDKRKIIYEIEVEETVGSINEKIFNLNMQKQMFKKNIENIDKEIALLEDVKKQNGD